MIATSGPHSNGYSLIRKVLEQSTPTDAQLKALIEPTKIYVKSVLSLIEKFPVHAISHITGGGLLENIPRVLPDNLAAKLNNKSWQMPKIFQFLQDNGNIDIMEMYRVFNCGVGMVLVVPADKSDAIIQHMHQQNENAWLIGKIVNNEGNQVII
jgi:phosphoribosylformylglycinamidine cyclo-ligase